MVLALVCVIGGSFFGRHGCPSLALVLALVCPLSGQLFGRRSRPSVEIIFVPLCPLLRLSVWHHDTPPRASEFVMRLFLNRPPLRPILVMRSHSRRYRVRTSPHAEG